MAIAFTSKKKSKKKSVRRQALTGKVALNLAIQKAEKEFKKNPSNDASMREDIYKMQEILTNLKNQALVYKSLTIFAVRAIDFYDGSTEEKTKKDKTPLDQIRELRQFDISVDDLVHECDDVNAKTTQALKCKSIPELATYFSDTMIPGFDSLQDKFTQIYFKAQKLFPQYLKGIEAQSEHAARFIDRNFISNRVTDDETNNPITSDELSTLSKDVISDVDTCYEEARKRIDDKTKESENVQGV